MLAAAHASQPEHMCRPCYSILVVHNLGLLAESLVPIVVGSLGILGSLLMKYTPLETWSSSREVGRPASYSRYSRKASIPVTHC